MGILSSLLGYGEGPPTPTGGTIVQEAQLAKEIAPFMQDLLKKGQALYKARTEEGYRPFEGQTLAELTPEQQQAMTGLTGLVGTTAPAFEEATGLARGVADKMTPTALEEYMSPYQQAVTDIEKAEAQRTFERDVLPKVRQAQIGAGAFGGTRGTMLEAQSLAEQQKLLGDIQTRGSQAAYTDAVRQFEAQKQREGATASALATLAPQALKTAGTEYELLRGVGQEKQQRSQQALDEAYKQYLEERVFPEKTLGQYQSVIAGFPSAQTTRTVQTTTPPQQSGLGSILGTLGNIGSLYGTFGGFSKGGIGSGFYPLGSQRAAGGPVLYRYSGGGSGGSGGASSYVNPIRYDRPNTTSPRELPTGSGLQSVVPSTSVPEQRLSTSELEAANQTALASGQPEFTYNGIRYAANPAGPIPIEEAIGSIEEQGIPTPITMSPQPMPISTAAPIMAPLLTHEVTGSRTQIPPLDTTPQYFIGKDSPSGRMPIGMPVTPGGPALAGGGLVSLPVVQRQNPNQVMTNQDEFLRRYGVSLPEGVTQLSELNPQQLRDLGLDVGLEQLMKPSVSEAAYQDLLTSKEATLEEEREMTRQQALIRALRGFSKGVGSGAGTGFWGEMQSGIGEAAEETMKYGEEAGQKLLDLKKDINEFKLKSQLAVEAGDNEKATKFAAMARSTYDDYLEEQKIEAAKAKTLSGLDQYGITWKPDYGVTAAMVKELIPSGMGKAITMDRVSDWLITPEGSKVTYSMTDILNLAYDKAKKEVDDLVKAENITGTPLWNENMANAEFARLFRRKIEEIVGKNPTAVLRKAAGGQIIKKQTGSMIDTPIQEKTTGEVLRELKGLRK